MANMLKKIKDAGRATDNIVGHLTNGEIVIPVQLAKIPEVKSAIDEIFAAYEVNLDEFTVGNEANKINPETGYPEFFFGKVFKAVGNAVKKVFGGGGDKKKNNNNNNNSQNNNQNNDAVATLAKQQAAIEAAIKETERKAEETRKEAERKAEEARKEAERKTEIARQSSKAQQQATLNQGEINQQIESKLNTPIVGQSMTQPTTYQSSGVAVVPKQNAVKSVGGAIQQQQPVGAIISKINEESGGTSKPQNFIQPNYQNLQFGGA